MYFTIFLLGVIVPFARADDSEDAPAAIDEKNFGKDMFCIFNFRAWVEESYMKESVPSAKKYGLGKLSNYRYDYVQVAEILGGFSTLEPEPGSEAWGITYLIPTSDYELTKENACNYKNMKVYNSVKVDIEVNVNNQCLTVPCNMFPTVVRANKVDSLPDCRKPIKGELEYIVSAYKKVGIPQDYIAKISQTPTIVYVDEESL